VRRIAHDSGRLIALSWAFLAIQVTSTDYGADDASRAVVWLVVGSVLLLLVHRWRSRIARGLLIVPALVGAIGYGLAAWTDASAVFVSATFLGQAVPLLMPGVRRHVHPAARDASAAFRLSSTTSARP
jgi:hypothetical protein